MKDPQNHTCSEDSYIQYVFDNADHNTCTTDGIMTATPLSNVTAEQPISRLEKNPSSDGVGKFGFIEPKNVERRNS